MVSRTQSPFTESNRRPSPYHGDALPTELKGQRRRTLHGGGGFREIGSHPSPEHPRSPRDPGPRRRLLELVGELQEGRLAARTGGEHHALREARGGGRE